jgi:hypothetical protein
MMTVYFILSRMGQDAMGCFPLPPPGQPCHGFRRLHPNLEAQGSRKPAGAHPDFQTSDSLNQEFFLTPEFQIYIPGGSGQTRLIFLS